VQCQKDRLQFTVHNVVFKYPALDHAGLLFSAGRDALRAEEHYCAALSWLQPTDGSKQLSHLLQHHAHHTFIKLVHPRAPRPQPLLLPHGERQALGPA
jgi:hypothetical protein